MDDKEFPTNSQPEDPPGPPPERPEIDDSLASSPEPILVPKKEDTHPFKPGTELIDQGGVRYRVGESTEPDENKIVLKPVTEGKGMDMTKTVDELGAAFVGEEWSFAQLDQEKILWLNPEIKDMMDAQPGKRAEVERNLQVITDKTADKDQLIKAQEALEIPPVILVSLLRRNGTDPEIIESIEEHYLGKEAKELVFDEKDIKDPELRAKAQNVQDLIKEAQGKYDDVLKNEDGFQKLGDKEQGEFLNTVAKLRAKLSDFKETKAFSSLKFSFKALLVFIAAVILLEMMVLRVHAGAKK